MVCSMTPIRDLSHGAQLTLQAIRKRRSHRFRGMIVHRCGRSLLANRVGRSCRQVSRYTLELERAGHILKIEPRRVHDPEKGWVTVEVQGYVIIEPERRARAKLTPAPHPSHKETRASGHLLRRSGLRFFKKRASSASSSMPPYFNDSDVQRDRRARREAGEFCCPVCGEAHTLATCPIQNHFL